MRIVPSFLVLLVSASIASADPHVTRVTTVATGSCSTDGGAAKCSTGVRYLGELIQLWFNSNLQDKPLACAADVKPGSFTIKLGYGYNDGKVFLQDDDKVKAKWPDCVQTFATRASEKLLEWWHVLQPIDGTIDINSSYKVTITIKR